MNTFRPSALFLAALLTGSLLGQAGDNTQRTLTTEGVSFKLPSGWQWQGEVATNIAIKKDIKVKDQTYTITAELIFQAEAFLEDSIAGIEKKVAASKGDLKDLKTNRKEKFAGNPATLVSLTRVRGEKKDLFEDERNYLFRRNNALYTWTERNDRVVAGDASSAFSAARSAVVFTQKDLAKSNAVRTWPDAGIKYTMPPDLELSGKPGELVKGQYSNLIHAVTAVTVKNEDFLVNVFLTVAKDDKSFDDLAKSAKERIRDQFEDIQDLQSKEGETFKGEKAVVVTFTGVQMPKERAEAPKDPNAPKQKGRPARESWWFLKHKGHVIEWREVTPTAPSPAVDAIIKKARDGLSWL